MYKIKFIVTRKNKDGTFDQVGMNNRFLTSNYKTLKGLLKYGISDQWKQTGFKVESFIDVYSDPLNVYFFNVCEVI